MSVRSKRDRRRTQELNGVERIPNWPIDWSMIKCTEMQDDLLFLCEQNRANKNLRGVRNIVHFQFRVQRQFYYLSTTVIVGEIRRDDETHIDSAKLP
jgi:hypothetical protein